MEQNIKIFKPNSELSSEKNLQNFIENAKHNLTAFSENSWEDNIWKTSRGTRRVVARFSSNLKQKNSYSFTPLSMPMMEFSKSFIKQSYSNKPVANVQFKLDALRIIEEALVDIKGNSNILELDGSVLLKINRILTERKNSISSKNTTGNNLENIFEFLRKNLITPSLPIWSSPYKKPKDLTTSLDKDGVEHRSSRLPSDEVMMLMADLFYRGPSLSIEAEYFSAIYTILMTAPSRGSEITALPVDCLIWEEDRTGTNRLGIKWTPAKNGKAGIKWVPSVMQEIVIDAIERLSRIGEPARRAAKFAEENPKKFWVHDDCITPENFSIDKPLNIDQINAAVSTNHSKFQKLNYAKWSKSLLDGNNNQITYRTLGEQQYKNYTKKFPLWPYIDKNKKVKVSEALALFRENEFNPSLKPRNFSFYPADVNAINKRFRSKSSHRYLNLWERHNITMSNGEKISISTHQARHWLCTMAENGGMGELTIANWAGRARIRDNASYDHRTEAEKSNEVRALMIPKDANVLAKIQNRLPVTFAEIGKDLPGSAIVTELGVCEHDYAIIPCIRNGDCETCKELVCIKGFSSSLELLKSREKAVATQLEKAMKDHEMGDFGADRWVSSHAWRLAHIRTKIHLLEDENIKHGTPVRIPDEFDPTPVKETLIKKRMILDIESSIDIKKIDSIMNLKNKNA